MFVGHTPRVVQYIEMGHYMFVILSIITAVTCQGVVTTYYDDTCVDAIGTFTLIFGECYNNPFLEGGIAVSSFPACESGVPSLSVSDYADCAVPSVPITHYDIQVESCYYLSGVEGIASVKFFCDTDEGDGNSNGGSPLSESFVRVLNSEVYSHC